MFSVIIPLFNKEKYIQKAISSVLNQSYINFELIIVNDGSTDKSLECVSKFNDDRLKIVSQNNQGVSLARNNGVRNSKYDLVAFLDADDWWHPDFLKEMLILIEKFSNAAVYSSSYFKVKNGENIPAKIGIDKQFELGYINYHQVYAKTFWVPVNCSFVVLRKEAFLEIGGFNEKLKFGEDFELWLRFSLKYKFAFLNKNLSFSNQDVELQNRALGNKTWKKEEHFLFHLNYFNKHIEKNKDLKFLIDGLILRNSLTFYLNKQHKTEIELLLKTVDFNSHDKLYYFIYNYPYFMVKFYLKIKEVLSNCKQVLLKLRKK